MNHNLGQKQSEILEYIKSEIQKKGYPPTVRDICEAVNLRSTASVHAHLTALENKGYIRRDPSKPRTIEITEEDFYPAKKEFCNVPVVGRIAAGEPILASENITDYFPIPLEYLPKGDFFMLNVKGESMINAGILDGDRLIVIKTSHAENGDTIVALVDDSATVKTFYKENGHYRLQPENPAYTPIIVEDLEILGKVIGVIRL